jgi:hypothetical protein
VLRVSHRILLEWSCDRHSVPLPKRIAFNHVRGTPHRIHQRCLRDRNARTGVFVATSASVETTFSASAATRHDGSPRRRQNHHDPGVAWPDPPECGARRDLRPRRATQRAAVHAHTAYVRGESTPSPALTGQETLHMLARMHGETDIACPGPVGRPVRVRSVTQGPYLLEGQPSEDQPAAAFATGAPLLILDEPTNVLDPLMEEVGRVRQAWSADRTV